MRRMRRTILYALCAASLALTALFILQGMGLAPPLGVGWGNPTIARAYSIEAREGLLVFRTATAMKQPPPGSGGLPFRVQTLGRWDATGMVYHRWNMTLG